MQHEIVHDREPFVMIHIGVVKRIACIQYNLNLIKRLVGSYHIKSFVVLHSRAMMYLRLMIVLLWAYIGNSFRRIGNYETYRCSPEGRFTLRCSISQMKWIRCANGKCAIIYQRTTAGIVVHNTNVLHDGTISGACANKHGWTYICHGPSKQSSWGIDNIGVNTRKY